MSDVTVQKINGTVNNKKIHFSLNLMTKNTILGIFLAGIMLCGSIPLGFSEPVLQQWKNTNDINEVSCDNANHVLVMRDNGNPACVTQTSAERLGWDIVETDFTIIEHATEINYETVNSKNNPNASKSNLDRIGGVTPFTSIQFPDTVNVGEEFEIVSSWQYFELNEDDEVDVLYTVNDNGHQNIVPTVIAFGNDHDNILIGNAGNNIIDGKKGLDIVQFSGNHDEYIIIRESSNEVIVKDMFNRDGVDTLRNIDTLRFVDKDITS